MKKSLRMTMTAFPRGLNGVAQVPCNEPALIRAAIAAGQNPRSRRKSPDFVAHLDELAFAIRSSLDMTGSAPKATPRYLSLGQTERGLKTYRIATALCAHAAYKQLNIPWLVDIEAAPADLALVFKRGSDKRPDFIGFDCLGQWHVFESKGRTQKASPNMLKVWKEQAKMIRRINNEKPKYHIVSSPYLNPCNEWELQWHDPSSEEGGFLEFWPPNFFKLYYRFIFSALNQRDAKTYESDNVLYVELAEARVSVGLHHKIMQALNTENYGAIMAFARDWPPRDLPLESEREEGFADGIFVRVNQLD